MIAISGVLVLIAIGLLVTGLVLPNLWFVYASIVVSLASAVCLVVGVFIGRGQGPTPRTASGKDARTKASGGPTGGSTKKKTTGGRPGGRRSAKAGTGVGTGAARGAAATATEEPAVDHELVVVAPGRLRYHLASCRQVTGRDTEELELAEARTQGYVACTSCRPDKVLAARAESEAATAAADAEAEAAEEAESAEGEGAETEPPPDEADEADAEAEAEGAEGEGESTAAEKGEGETAATSESAAEQPEATTEVQVVAGQRRYHLPTCQVIEDAAEDDAEVEILTLATARSRELTPCRVCASGDQS